MFAQKIVEKLRGTPIFTQWLITRSLLLGMAGLGEWGAASGDFAHYFEGLNGPRGTVIEYPEPVVTILRVPDLFAASADAYKVWAFAFFMLLDLAATWYVSRQNFSAARWWVWLSAITGPLIYLRFDLLVALVSLIAVSWGLSRPQASGALLGLGAAWKYWPAALVVLLLRRGGGARVLGWFLAVFGAATAATWVFMGWSRVWSPLSYQQRRGVECEAIVATPFLVLRSLFPDRWRVELSEFHAFEVFGPGVSTAKSVSTGLTLLAGVLIVLLWLRLARRPYSHLAFAWSACAATSLVMVSNLVLSPQYFLWLVAPVAILLTLMPSGKEKKLTVIATVVILALTHLEYPIMGSFLFSTPLEAWGHVATWIVVLRNLLFCALAAWFVRGAWRASAQPLRRFAEGDAPDSSESGVDMAAVLPARDLVSARVSQ